MPLPLPHRYIYSGQDSEPFCAQVPSNLIYMKFRRANMRVLGNAPARKMFGVVFYNCVNGGTGQHVICGSSVNLVHCQGRTYYQ